MSCNPAEPVHPEISSGFPPIVADGARVLVLGTLPSRQSLLRMEYYGNPHNAFWRIMGRLFDAGPELPYETRVDRLTSSGVAVWDVLRSSVRPGSMDASIDLNHARPNDFATFLGMYSRIATICFNGKKAGQLFHRLVIAKCPSLADEYRYLSLPSTSPAHAALSFERKLTQWSRIQEALTMR